MSQLAVVERRCGHCGAELEVDADGRVSHGCPDGHVEDRFFKRPPSERQLRCLVTIRYRCGCSLGGVHSSPMPRTDARCPNGHYTKVRGVDPYLPRFLPCQQNEE
jgi:hypothetical protein